MPGLEESNLGRLVPAEDRKHDKNSKPQILHVVIRIAVLRTNHFLHRIVITAREDTVTITDHLQEHYLHKH